MAMKTTTYGSTTPTEGKDVSQTSMLKPGAKESPIYQGGTNTQDRYKGKKVTMPKGGAKGFAE